MSTQLRRVQEFKELFVDRQFAEAVTARTREHVGHLIDGLLDCKGEPAIHEVATVIGVFLEVRVDMAWAIGDTLVAVDARREEMGIDDDQWSNYLRALAGMVGLQRGYNTLWNYYSAARAFPPDLRAADRPFTWYRELLALAASQARRQHPMHLPRPERNEQKEELARGLLPEMVEDNASITDMQRERRRIVSGDLIFRVPLADYMEVVDQENGEVSRFLAFCHDKSLTDEVRGAQQFILSRFGLFPRWRVPHVSLVLQEGQLLTEDGQKVARLGVTELAKRAFQQVRVKLGL